MAFIDEIKPWFQTGDEPTQAQFYSFFEKLRWKDEAITMADIAGLVSALVSKVNTSDYEGQLIDVSADYTYTIPAGCKLEEMIIYMGSTANVRVSKITMGDEDVMNEIEMAAGWNDPVIVNKFAPTDMAIYIWGIPAGSKICFLKRKIKMV
jgi:hypothetical protein